MTTTQLLTMALHALQSPTFTTPEARADLAGQIESALAADAGDGVPTDGWLQDGSLLYRLTDERRPQNRDEIHVTMADGSHHDLAARERRATALLAVLNAAPAAPQFAAAPADEREAFEAEFQKPFGVIWGGTGYVVREGWEDSYRCDGFIQQWRAWQARAALAAAPEVAAPPGTLRFDLQEDDWFKNDTGPYPLYHCLDCRQRDYGPTRVEHKPGCRVAAALADRAAQAACTGGARHD